MATMSSGDYDELASLLFDEDTAVPAGAPVLRNQAPSTLFAAPQDEDILCLDRMLAHHMVNLTSNLCRLLGKTRDALGRGHTLRTVMLAVMEQEALYLQTDQPDVAAAVAAAVYFYSRLTASTMQKLISRGASASTTAPPLASHVPTDTLTDESSTPPPATDGSIASEGYLAHFPPDPIMSLHTEAPPSSTPQIPTATATNRSSTPPATAGPITFDRFPPTPIAALYTGAAQVPTATPTDESPNPRATDGPIDFGGPFVPSPPVPTVAAHTAAAAAAVAAAVAVAIGVEGTPVSTSAGPAEIASAVTHPSLSVGGEAAATMPAVRRARRTCDVCKAKKARCKRSEVGVACEYCTKKGIPCVFSPTEAPGPKPGSKRRRGSVKTELSGGSSSQGAIAPDDDPRAGNATVPSSQGSSTIGRGLPSVATQSLDAPTAREADSASELAAAIAAAPAAAVAAVAAEASALQRRDSPASVTSMSGLKRRSPDAVNASADESAGGEWSLDDENENEMGRSSSYAGPSSPKKARGSPPALPKPPGTP